MCPSILGNLDASVHKDPSPHGAYFLEEGDNWATSIIEKCLMWYIGRPPNPGEMQNGMGVHAQGGVQGEGGL